MRIAFYYRPAIAGCDLQAAVAAWKAASAAFGGYEPAAMDVDRLGEAVYAAARHRGRLYP